LRTAPASHRGRPDGIVFRMWPFRRTTPTLEIGDGDDDGGDGGDDDGGDGGDDDGGDGGDDDALV